MGLFRSLKQFLAQDVSTTEQKQRNVPAVNLELPRSRTFEPAPAGWFMPQYKDRDICDWLSDVSMLKRENNLDAALEIAKGCMAAMQAAAEVNQVNVMERYVIEVALILRKMKDYEQEIAVINDWLSRNFRAPREDFRIELRKRLAKVNELWANAQNRDASAFRSEWKYWNEQSKKLKELDQQGSSVSSGSNLVDPLRAARRVRSKHRYLPYEDEFEINPFVAVDFETANRGSGVSACQVALVKVENGKIIDTYSTLLKPPRGFDTFEFSELHGITKWKVRKAPSWPEVENRISQFVAGLPVYAHNSYFDAGVWRDLDQHFGTNSLPQPLFCSYRTAQRILDAPIPNFKLPTVLEACVPGHKLKHHRADSDAEACGLIVAALQRSYFSHRTT